MNLFSAEVNILWPALIAGILVVISHVPMGQQVLARGIVFIDLAIAQVAGLGVITAHRFGVGVGGWTTQAAAVAAALAGALLLTWTERKRPEVQEALIGILFVLASTAQILVLANDPHGGEDLRDLLAGQILWVSTEQLVRTAVVTAAMLRTWPVRLPAIRFTLSVRSFQVPATPFTRAWPPSFPSVPTSRATRVTSEAKEES